MSARELVYARLTELVDELLLHDPLVRAEAPDAVHRMRIASRRLRSNLATYRPVLDREATDPVRDELRWLGQVLGCARDSEVQAVHVERALDELDPELVRGPVRARLQAHAQSNPTCCAANKGEVRRAGRRRARITDALS